jgi:hypothetical protein
MKSRFLIGAVGVALCMLMAPAQARQPSTDDSHSGSHDSRTHGILNFDHPVFWASRQQGHDGAVNEARRDPPKRRHQPVRLASHGPSPASSGASPTRYGASTPRHGPIGPGRPSHAPSPSDAPSLASGEPPVAGPDAIASRSLTAIARGSGGGSRGCLTTSARALLDRIESQFGPMQIVSTCRPGARIRGTGRISRHASGNAIDFNAGGRKGEVVRWLIANHKEGGVMTYAGMSHVHVDIGYRFVALNSGGRRR